MVDFVLDGQESQCGWLKDRYGLSWQVVPDNMAATMNDPDRGRVDRMMQAVLTMTKLGIAAIERAADNVS